MKKQIARLNIKLMKKILNMKISHLGTYLYHEYHIIYHLCLLWIYLFLFFHF